LEQLSALSGLCRAIIKILEVLMLRRFALLFIPLLLVMLAGCSDNNCPTCAQKGPIFYVTTHKIDFGATETVATFTIVNKGEKTLTWDINFGSVDWLDLSATSGTGDKVVTCTADRSNLPNIGVFRATIIIDSNGDNMTRDSIEVFILDSGTWLITDGGEFDTCWVVDQYDYYWVKGFALPNGVDAAFVDSVSFNFCEGGGAIQLLGFDAQWSSDQEFWFPLDLVYASDAAYIVPDGWSTIPANMYVSNTPFFFGYFQTESDLPRPSIDTMSDIDTVGSLRARDFAEDPNNPDLYWELAPGFQTLAIRVFISPVIEYDPKRTVAVDYGVYGKYVREQFARRGCNIANIEPGLLQK
jgi:hypothetical protein